MSDDDKRDPNAFLHRIKEEEAQQKRGHLKIFFGAVAGVGKTYAMLQAAQKLRSDGTDVVVGYVETHSRAETEALLEGLEQLPTKRIEYRGTWLKEFDIDGALQRKPEVILVDELAHTNAPGSRHLKRWQDVEELLNNGIDVLTTLNVQHIESLNDVVSQITRVTVHERVPDSLIERAAEMELIDLPPDELIQRLKEGKVYVAEQAGEALEKFFRKGNLIALRELALRVTAARVETQMDQYRKSYQIGDSWPVADRIMVCVSPSPLAATLVRAAKRMAAALRAKWMVAYVVTPAHASLPERDKARIAQTLRLAEQLGADTIELTGNSVSEMIIKSARQNNISKLVVGKPAMPRWKELIFGSIVDSIIRLSGNIDVYVITGEEQNGGYGAQSVRSPSRSKPTSYLFAFLVVTICTVMAKMMFPFFELSNLVMVYFVGVVLVSTRQGIGPSTLASVLSVAAFDFFFVPPYLTFAVSDTQYLITFGVMLTVAMIISTLTGRVKLQAESAVEREQRTSALYSLSCELSSSIDLQGLIQTGLKHIADVFDSRVALLMPSSTGHLIVKDAGMHSRGLPVIDEGVAQWVFRNKQTAGAGTDTLPASAAVYIPLIGSRQAIGVLAIQPSQPDRLESPEQLRWLETFANQMAIACERAQLTEENERTRIQMKTEQLRSSLLSSVSHDLRTPLATITGAASSIIEGSQSLDLESCKAMAGEIYTESMRLNRLVKNLLDMTKVQSGALKVKKEWHPADEVIAAAISSVDDQLGGNRIRTHIPDDIPMLPVDAELIHQVLVNLLENAIKYCEPPGTFEVAVYTDADHAYIEVSDRGPGIPDEHKQLIFQKFYREDPGKSSGAGLGLSICSGIMETHGGEISVHDRPGGGSIFRLKLPLTLGHNNNINNNHNNSSNISTESGAH